MPKLKFAILLAMSISSRAALAQSLSPEVEACKASGLIALQQMNPQVKDVEVDLDSAKIIKTDAKIEATLVKTVVVADAYVERTKATKPKTLVCIIGDKGKVLLTLFSDK